MLIYIVYMYLLKALHVQWKNSERAIAKAWSDGRPRSMASPTLILRVAVSTEWEQKFLLATVEALSREISDHTPMAPIHEQFQNLGPNTRASLNLGLSSRAFQNLTSLLRIVLFQVFLLIFSLFTHFPFSFLF